MTLLERDSMSRITIDTNLEVEAADGSSFSLPDMAVVETKTSGRPCAIDHFLWSLHQRPTKISKYCTGLAALTPGLPANKWNRVLRAHFGWTPEPIQTFLADDQLPLSQTKAWRHTFEACPAQIRN